MSRDVSSEGEGAASPAPEHAPARAEPVRLLFVCVENSCRSQMAEGFARAIGGGAVEARSAGSEPSGRVDPGAIEAMREVGVDLTTHRSKPVREVEGRRYDAIVSMGCGDACPHVPARRRIEWDVPDPKDMPPDDFRRVRDRIRGLVEKLIGDLGADA